MVLPLRTRQGNRLLRHPYRPGHPRWISGIGSVYLYCMEILIYRTWVFVNRILPGYKYPLRATHMSSGREFRVPLMIRDLMISMGFFCFPAMNKETGALLYQNRSQMPPGAARVLSSAARNPEIDGDGRSREGRIYFIFFLTYGTCGYTIYL